MVKKGYMKTMEALLAIIITALFIVLLIPKMDTSKTREERLQILDKLEKDDEFRINIINSENECYNKSSNNILSAKMDNYLLDEYNFRLCINSKALNLSEQKTYVDSVYILGNMTNYSNKIVRLYYWIE